MKIQTKWLAGAIAVAGSLIMASMAQAQVISDFSNNFGLSAYYANWANPGWDVIDGGAGIQAPVITSGVGPGTFGVQAGGYGSGHYGFALGNEILVNPAATQSTLVLTINSPANPASSVWFAVKWDLSDDHGNTLIQYGAYTGLWGADAWANGMVGTAVWSGNTLTISAPLTPAMLTAVQTGTDKIVGFNLELDPAYFASGGPGYDITYQSLSLSPVPEPSTLALAGLGGLGLLLFRRRN
jgi:hypothetical protein